MAQSRDDVIQDQEELNAQQAASQTASQVAARQAQRGPQQGQLLEELSDPDIFNGDDEVLEQWLGIDFARSHALAQKEEEDVWRDRWLNENEADRIIHEHNPGRLCFGPFLELAQGVHDRDVDAQGKLTNVGKRKVRTALDAKTAFQTMAKNGRTFKGVTEIVTTNKVERNDGSDADRGRLGKVRDKLFG
ncbi:MAG: hypothetical protein RI568_13120 [Natronomonas sp.]|uniref:hypothetical protein n=1 Tax=Natronomonas sp. TaxID=2184060 RepID=UPI0028701754|nr:hypothetical protein [Natronomonas sp.]MDR9431623.1 hypothetical protein [Natronomonas sp.]